MGPVVITGLGCFGVAVLAGSAGVGGGGLYVPLLMLTLQMEMGDAVVLSHVVVFGSVAAQVLVNLPRRHKTMPLIDYVAPVLLLPAQLSGSALGLCLRTLFPRAVLVCVCVVILTLLSRKMVSTAIAMHTVEKREKHVGGSGLHECLLTQPPGGPDAETADRLDCRGRLAQLPWASLVFLAAFLGTFLLCLLALGGDLKVPYVRRAQPCSAEYWAFTLLAVSLGALAALGAVPALQPATLAAAPAYAVSEDPVWLNGEPQLERAPSSPDGAHSVAILPAAAAAAGFVAGLLGLGGGELIGPLCVVLGMPTQVAGKFYCVPHHCLLLPHCVITLSCLPPHCL